MDRRWPWLCASKSVRTGSIKFDQRSGQVLLFICGAGRRSGGAVAAQWRRSGGAVAAQWRRFTTGRAARRFSSARVAVAVCTSHNPAPLTHRRRERKRGGRSPGGRRRERRSCWCLVLRNTRAVCAACAACVCCVCCVPCAVADWRVCEQVNKQEWRRTWAGAARRRRTGSRPRGRASRRR